MMAVLEVMNGSAIVPGLICIGLLVRYLINDIRRRRLADREQRRVQGVTLLHLPPGMDLVLAFAFLAFAVWGEKVLKWVWRRFLGGDDIGAITETTAMVIFGGMVSLALLCVIRALTRPDHGNGPWFLSAVLTVLGFVILLATRSGT